MSFVRAPTSFADTELHVVTGQYPPGATYSSKVVSATMSSLALSTH